MKVPSTENSKAVRNEYSCAQERRPLRCALLMAALCASSALACTGQVSATAKPVQMPLQELPVVTTLSLVEHPFFNGGAEYTRTSATIIERGSLNADILAELIRDRVKRLALQATVKEIGKAAQTRAAGFPLRDVLEHAVPLFTEQGAIQRDEVEALVKSITRAVIATYLVNRLPSATGLDINTMAAWKGKKLDASDVLWARSQLVALTYWWLGSTTLLAVKDAPVPACSAGNASEARANFCTEISLTPDKLKEWLEKNVKVGTAFMALRALSQIALPGPQEVQNSDIAGFIKAIGETTTIASFNGTTGLNLDDWSSVARTMNTKLGPLNKSIVNLSAAFSSLVAETSKPNNVSQISAAAKTLGEHLSAAPDVVKALWSSTKWQEFIDAAKTLETTAAPVPTAFAIYISRQTSPFADVSSLLNSVTNQLAILERAEQAIRGTVTGKNMALDGLDFKMLKGLIAQVKNATTAAFELNKILVALNLQPDATLHLIERDSGSLKSVLEQLTKLDLPEFRDKTVRQVVDELRALGPRIALLMKAITPTLELTAKNRELDAAAVITIVQRVDVDDMLGALGIDTKSCDAGDDRALCWGSRVVLVLRDSIESDGKSVKLNGTKLAEGLSTLGDDFKRRNEGGPFFHLTVGLGGIYAVAPPQIVEKNVEGVIKTSLIAGPNRWAPLAAEQIGFGYAGRTRCDDWLTPKVGLFASGLLYRALVDSTESQSIMAGAFVAVDIKESIELYGAAMMMFYPPIAGNSYAAQPGLSLGVQIPLGDYLMKSK